MKGNQNRILSSLCHHGHHDRHVRWVQDPARHVWDAKIAATVRPSKMGSKDVYTAALPHSCL